MLIVIYLIGVVLGYMYARQIGSSAFGQILIWPYYFLAFLVEEISHMRKYPTYEDYLKSLPNEYGYTDKNSQ